MREEILGILSSKELSPIIATRKDALALLEKARRHLASCEVILDSDLEGVAQFSYDAARKVLAAILALQGLRVHERGGSHSSFVKLSKLSALDSEVWVVFEEMKRQRNIAEYGVESGQVISHAWAKESIEAATKMVEDVARLIDSQQ